jgi:hypothetical protein
VAGEYPQRDQFFAHKFVRLLHKAAIAAEIGRDAFALLTVVVHTEDAMRYRGPAKFWNSQLIETLGFAKWETFDRARTRAIESGWLQYSGDGKRTAGEYFVTVPDGYEQISDAPIEWTCTVVNPENGYEQGYKAGYEAGMIEGIKRGRSGVRSGDEQGEPSNPIPNPIPVPEETYAAEAADRETLPAVIETEKRGPANIVAAGYIAAIGGRVTVTDKRRAAITARWKDRFWRENWQEALEVASSSPFLRGNNGTGWKITFDWFIKPDSVTKILEGNYSGGSKQGNQTAAEKREQLNASGFDWLRQAAAEAASCSDNGGNLSASVGKTLFVEEHGAVDSTCV